MHGSFIMQKNKRICYRVVSFRWRKKSCLVTISCIGWVKKSLCMREMHMQALLLYGCAKNIFIHSFTFSFFSMLGVKGSTKQKISI